MLNDNHLVVADQEDNLIKLLDTPISIKTTPKTALIETKEDCKKLTLSEAQKWVEGWIEGITLSNGDYMIVNEEGKFKKFAINYTASMVWAKHFGKTNFMLGNAIIIKKNALAGDWI